MLSGDRQDTERLMADFPLFQAGEYDFYYKNAPWKIGLESTCPAELKRKIAGAFISETLQLKSVDNVLKKYLANIDYVEADDDRLDLRIRRHIEYSMKIFHDAIRELSKAAPQNINYAVCGWTLIRAPFSIEQMAYCSNRGALFEANAIARMMIEQLAWAHYTFLANDTEDVFLRKPQSCIASLKINLWYGGYLYGWMSNHAHWSFDAHKKSAISHSGQFGHLWASTYFKALSFALMLVLVDAYTTVSIAMLAKYKPESTVWWDAEKAQAVKHQCHALMVELVACCDKDSSDLAELAAMLDVESVE